MASKKRQTKPPAPSKGRGGRFVSKETKAAFEREKKERKKDKTFLRRSMEQRLAELQKNPRKRKRIDDGRNATTAILERLERERTKSGKKRKHPLGSRTVGDYRLIVFKFKAPLEKGREKAQQYIIEKTKRGDVVWIQIVTPNNMTTGTIPDKPAGAFMQLDRDVLSRKYINMLANRDLKNYKWEIVIEREVSKSTTSKANTRSNKRTKSQRKRRG